MKDLTPAMKIECELVEINEALAVIQLLLPEDAPETRDQETLAGVGYLACTIRGHVKEIEAALLRMKAEKGGAS